MISATGKKRHKEGGYVFRGGQFTLLNKEVRGNLSRKHASKDLTGRGLNYIGIWEKGFPDRGNSQCKDPKRPPPGVTSAVRGSCG